MNREEFLKGNLREKTWNKVLKNQKEDKMMNRDGFKSRGVDTPVVEGEEYTCGNCTHVDGGVCCHTEADAGEVSSDYTCDFWGEGSPAHINNTASKETGSKFDEDLYEKVDWSLIPWLLLEEVYYKGEPEEGLVSIQTDLHNALNIQAPKDTKGALVAEIFEQALTFINVKELSVVLGYGAVKYGRDNYKKGFSGDPDRFLRAAMRHLHTYLTTGNTHDGQAIEGYPKGNSHLGAVLFGLMVACKELGNWEY